MQTNAVPTLRSLGYITEREAAKLLKIALGTLQNWRRSGRAPPFTPINGDTYVYPLADLQQWLAGRTVAATQAVPGSMANPRLRRRAEART